MQNREVLVNRLKKNFSRLKPWATKYGYEAFRIYERDVPEFPFIVDLYRDKAVVYDFRKDFDFDAEIDKFSILEGVLSSTLNFKEVILKIRKRQRVDTKASQYERIDKKKIHLEVREGKARFLVNLHDYIDTGLFLDHRLLRERVYARLTEKMSFLNLFCYTGAFSVYAGLKGAKTINVDLSKTYLQWARENYRLNGLDPLTSEWVHMDVLEYLKQMSDALFDVILLDPPTFSNSKRMTKVFDVQAEHSNLVTECMQRLKPKGICYFSTNLRSFKLDSELKKKFKIVDISQETLPRDFRDLKIRQVFEISQSS